MPRYRYRARGVDGARHTGVQEAADVQSLLELLHRKGMYCYEYRIEEAESGWRTSVKLKSASIPPLCRQMSAMLGAGVSVSRALWVCAEASQERFLKRVLERLNETVQKGRTLSEAMGEMEGVFPELLVHMAAMGESSGTLDRIMDQMADYYGQEMALRKKIQNAMTYPAILLAVTLASTAFMLTAVLPQFASLLSGTDLPAFTRFLLRVSSLFQHHGLWLLLGCLGMTALAAGLLSVQAVRRQKDRLLLGLPVLGHFWKTVYTSQFASAFAVLYGNGVGILTSLDAAAAVMGNTYIRACLKDVEEDLRKGEMLSRSLKNQNIFLPVFVSMVVAGEEAGGLERVLDKAGDFYKKEAERALEQMIALLEPCMMIVMALIVGSIVIAVMMPIYTMYSHMLR